jgi:hypothetical protein
MLCIKAFPFQKPGGLSLAYPHLGVESRLGISNHHLTPNRVVTFAKGHPPIRNPIGCGDSRKQTLGRNGKLQMYDVIFAHMCLIAIFNIAA